MHVVGWWLKEKHAKSHVLGRSGSQINAAFAFHAKILITHGIMFIILKYLLKNGFLLKVLKNT